MLNAQLKGADLTPFDLEVDPARLGSFAQATGQDDPVYRDPGSARAAGHPALPIPPTFLFCLSMGPHPMEVYERLGVQFAHVLHAEQHFVYHRLAFAGETLRFKPRIADLFEKKGGALEFIVWETRVEGEDGAAVADLRSVMVVCQPEWRTVQPARPFDVFPVGDALPGLVAGPITRDTLRSYAHASGDCNPLHLDPDFARRVGMPDVIAHGMLSAAYLARLLTRWVRQEAIRSLSVRFVAISQLGDEVHCHARISDRFVLHGESCASIELTAHNQRNEIRLLGTAVVALGCQPLQSTHPASSVSAAPLLGSCRDFSIFSRSDRT